MALPEGNRLPAFVDVPTSEEVVELALLRLLRGGTWQGLANELAWEAVRATGVELSCLDWLSQLVDARLSARVDGLEFVLEPARASARAEHLSRWPNDHSGAETAATLAADEEAAHQLGRLYLEVLEWALALLQDRLSKPKPAGSQRPRLAALRRERPPAEPEVPVLVADSLSQEREPHGWPARSARAVG